MTYNQEITLDLNSNSAFTVVDAKQGDVNSRVLLVHYTANGEEYLVDGNNSVALRMKKPDGSIIFNDEHINNDGTVTVTFTYQCLSVAGRAYADLVEFNSAGQTLSTVSFIVNIMASPSVAPHEELSSDEFLYLKSFIDRGNSIIGEAQRWANGKNGDVPVSASDPAYKNNAKYYKEAIQNMAIEVVTLEPGQAATSSNEFNSTTDKLKLKLGIPSVKFTPTASASIAAGSNPNVSVNVSGSGLNKSLDFSFAIPRGEAAGFNSAIGVDFTTVSNPASAYFTASFINSDNTSRQLKFNVGLPSGPQGVAGVGISGCAISSGGELIISYTDGRSQNVGRVVGTQGPKGDPGTTGSKGDRGEQGTAIFGVSSYRFNGGTFTTSGTDVSVNIRTSSSGDMTDLFFDFIVPITIT